MMFNLCYTAARGRESDRSERGERRKSERIKKEAKGKKKINTLNYFYFLGT